MTTAAEKKHIHAVAQLPCIAGYGKGRYCMATPVTIHHCGTYMGGGRNHMRVIPLCWPHHLGSEGIDGKRMGKRVWEEKYGTEEDLLRETALQLLVP